MAISRSLAFAKYVRYKDKRVSLCQHIRDTLLLEFKNDQLPIAFARAFNKAAVSGFSRSLISVDISFEGPAGERTDDPELTSVPSESFPE